jgi:hypothetical protein
MAARRVDRQKAKEVDSQAEKDQAKKQIKVTILIH